MTPEELLKPRVLVATDWPGRRDFEVGQIILLDKIFGDGSPMWEITDCQGTRTYIKKLFEMFPLQFKFLEWWEEREEKDMPEYVKYRFMPDSKEYIFKTPDHFTDSIGLPNKRGFFVIGYGYCSYSKSFPATESEYNEYINRVKS